MKRRATTMVLFALLCATGLARAQQAERPQSQDETPTLTTEDVAPSVPSAASSVVPSMGAPPSLDAMWEQAYASMARTGASEDDVARFRARIESGGEVGFTVRFDVGPDGRIANFVTERATGLASLDRSLDRGAEGESLGPKFAGFHDVRIDVGVTKTRLRLNATATAPTAESAAEIEREMQEFRAQASASGAPASLLSNVSLTRQGATIHLSVGLSLAEILQRR